MMLLAWLLALLAMLTLLIAALGVVRLPDALSRQHAATKAATLAVTLFAIALVVTASVSGWGWGWIGRLLVMVAILICVLPLASHALGRAGLAETDLIDLKRFNRRGARLRYPRGRS
jgi:multicomponent Na+:H+ antiporter subunit G